MPQRLDALMTFYGLLGELVRKQHHMHGHRCLYCRKHFASEENLAAHKRQHWKPKHRTILWQ